ncbi:histone-lysine N-methyltransferase TRX1-like [Tasmannia lanceolata]|uniref:histone-lysine N-methyltransferase TRX1-like n=1 Tax=Tasmannia lanceolata TaxID=3420 RepID=UPI0040645665
MALPLQQKFMHEEEDIDNGTPIRYLPLSDLYSATSPCINASGSSNVMSKKVKARKLIEPSDSNPEIPLQKLSLLVYKRRPKKIPRISPNNPLELEKSIINEENERGMNGDDRSQICEEGGELGSQDCIIFEGFDGADGEDGILDSVMAKSNNVNKKRKKRSKYELFNLGVESSDLLNLAGHWSRGIRSLDNTNSARTRKCGLSNDPQKNSSALVSAKRWIGLSFEDVDPRAFIGLQCKVHWPLDDAWYTGRVTGYNSETQEHDIKYDDGDGESLILSGEKMRFYLSREEIHRLNLKCSFPNTEKKGPDVDEMLVLAADFVECPELEPGDIVWAKLSGHAMWPAVVIAESHVDACGGLKANRGERSVAVQFFGTHDFARIHVKQTMPFLTGLLSSFHLKCNKTNFCRSLEEAKMYLKEHKLPNNMLRMQNDIGPDDSGSASGEDEEGIESGEDYRGDEGMQKCIQTCPFEIGDLRVTSLGKIVTDSEYFHDKRYIWPEGYTALRKYSSTTDPSVSTFYKMEVLRDHKSKAWPLFRVTLENGEQIDGSTPGTCWKKIYRRIKKIQNNNLPNGFHDNDEGISRIYKPGSYMFGFSVQKIFELIKDLPNGGLHSMSFSRKVVSESYRPVRIDWKDLDKCSVCHMDEEYENNLFLQCDKCRMMVHARCYGEIDPLDGELWLCNLCGPKAPRCPPRCCLCPITGGAMKPTTDGRWAHLTCAMWIPETCLQDVKRMEPIDGLDRINKDRWKLLCSICGVSYGACIQCSNSTCRVAYHPLCARAAGLCVELEDESRLLHLLSVDEDDDDQCIRLLSFCKKHRQPSTQRSPDDRQILQRDRNCYNYNPPSNPSGCARSEPYGFFGRRGRKEPEALAAASLKRLFVENRPYLVSGYRQNGSIGNDLILAGISSGLQKSEMTQPDGCGGILSMAEKFKFMRETFRKRLAFGKSGIHGFGVFAKHAYRAGDMVIEYTGEIVRPPISDIREHYIYNSLVGAGTYMFRIDDERVIDATRAGSIAHLINHSCEPNCYSRSISVKGDEHIIIFAKRDINQWEELTYDYRFFSIDEQLECCCGFPRCRGVVNDKEAEEQTAKIFVSRRELINWEGE